MMRLNGISKRNLLATSPLCSSLALGACSTGNKRTGQGALGGAAVGAAVGAMKGGVRGAAIGAAAGGAAGAAVGNYLDRRARELEKVVETKKTEDGLLVTLKNDVLFDFNKSTLRAEAQQTLTELAEILNKYPQDKLRVSGFADNIGKASYNQKLSESRAESVKSFLAEKGVSDDRINAVGLGETRAKGDTDAERQQDRKVEIFIDVQQPAKNQQG